MQKSIHSDEASLTGCIYALLVVLLFTGFVLVSKFGLATSLRLHDLAALRFGIGAILLLPFVVSRGFGGLGFGQIIVMAASGGLGFALLAYIGFALAPPSHGGVLIHGTLALTTAFIIWCVGGDRPEGRHLIGLTTVLAGVVCMALEGWTSASPTILLGDLSLISASFCWSGYGIYAKRNGIAAVQAAAVVAVTSATAFLPIYFVLPGKMLWRAGWDDILIQALFQGVLIGAGSIFIYTRAVRSLGPERLSIFTAAVPLLALIGAFVFLSEIPAVSSLLGVALVTAGMLVSLTRDKAFRARLSGD